MKYRMKLTAETGVNTTRLLITTTAQMMERGQGYYSNRYLFFSMPYFDFVFNFGY